MAPLIRPFSSGFPGTNPCHMPGASPLVWVQHVNGCRPCSAPKTCSSLCEAATVVCWAACGPGERWPPHRAVASEKWLQLWLHWPTATSGQCEPQLTHVNSHQITLEKFWRFQSQPPCCMKYWSFISCIPARSLSGLRSMLIHLPCFLRIQLVRARVRASYPHRLAFSRWAEVVARAEEVRLLLSTAVGALAHR